MDLEVQSSSLARSDLSLDKENLKLKPQAMDLEGQSSSLARSDLSLDKELYSTSSLLTQVYKWVPATYCWRITLP